MGYMKQDLKWMLLFKKYKIDMRGGGGCFSDHRYYIYQNCEREEARISNIRRKMRGRSFITIKHEIRFKGQKREMKYDSDDSYFQPPAGNRTLS